MITNFNLFEEKELFDKEKVRVIKGIIRYSTQDMFSCGELESDPILLYESDGKKALIEYFYENSFDYTVYSGYKFSTELKTIELPYEGLKPDIITEILTILEEGVDYNMIEIDNEPEIENEDDFNEFKYIANECYDIQPKIEYSYEHYKMINDLEKFNI